MFGHVFCPFTWTVSVNKWHFDKLHLLPYRQSLIDLINLFAKFRGSRKLSSEKNFFINKPQVGKPTLPSGIQPHDQCPSVLNCCYPYRYPWPHNYSYLECNIYARKGKVLAFSISQQSASLCVLPYLAWVTCLASPPRLSRVRLTASSSCPLGRDFYKVSLNTVPRISGIVLVRLSAD